MAAMSVSGIVSGMDWESMIDEIITNAAKPAQPQVSKKTNLTNKKSLFEEMKTTMNSLQSSLSPLKLPSTYKAKTIDIERLDKNSSYKGVLTATVNADAEVNVWDVTVKQLASAQINRSKQITGSSLSSTLSGVSGNTMYVNAGGQKIGIEVKSSDTLESLKSRINTTLKTLDSPIYVTASVVDNKLILKSDYTGKGTMTATETTRYNYSSGINRLSNISIPEAAYDNVKVTSGSKSYVIHKDFEVANGNEIRWKQYDRGNDNQLEVGLSDEVNINYKMAAGDQYTAKGTYNDKAAEISGFDLVNNGTLASRAKIVDDNGIEYVYGKDFKIEDKKIVWLEAPEDDDSPKTNEPDSYNVNYTKDIPVENSKTYTKKTETNEPASYTVSYDKTVEGNYNVAGTKTSPVSIPDSYTVSYDKVLEARVSSSANVVDLNRTASGDIPTFVEFRDYYDIPVITWNTYKVLDFDSSSKDKIEIVENGSVSSYSCGTGTSGDFIMRKATYGTSNPENQPEWNNYVDIQWLSSNKPSSEYTVRHTHTYSASSNDSSGIEEVITAAGTDNITITGSDGTEYVQGTHFEIRGGKIVWKTQDEITDLTNEQFADLQAQYKEGTGSDLATKTLIDGDGVIRTYVDPEDPSLFNMSAGGKDYVYGRDYVLRVNDSGSGYRFDWLVDDSNTITDANTSVSTYAAYRNISTQTWQKAPADDTAYTFNFAGSHDTTITADVTSTQSDKTLSGILGETVTDTSKVSITDANGNVRTDYTISGDTITWSGTAPSNDDTFNQIDALQAAFKETTGSSSIPRVTLTDSDGVLRTYLDLDGSDVNFQLSDGSKNYTYGRDYVIRVSDDGQDYVISWAVTGDTNSDGTYDIKDFNPVVAAYAAEKDINTSNWQTAPSSGNFTFTTTYTKTVSYSGNAKSTTADSDKTLTKILGTSSISQADYGNVTIPGYTQGQDYVINSTGTIRWINQNSKTPDAYKAVYKFSDTPSTTISIPDFTGKYTTVSGANAGGLSIAALGGKTITSGSYTYIDEAEGKAMFTMTDDSGNLYEYGKDYAVRYTTSGTGTTALTIVMPNGNAWPSTFSNQTRTTTMPKSGLKLTYNNAVSRFVDSTDTLSAGLGFTPSTLSKLTLSDAYGNEYTEGTNYTIDSAGNVTWIEQTTDAPASYTVSYRAAQTASITHSTSNHYDNLSTSTSGFPNIDGLMNTYGFSIMNTTSNPSNNVMIVDYYNPSSTDDYKFVVSVDDGSGNYSDASQYIYGRDYVVRKSGPENNASRASLIMWPDRFEINTYKNYVAANYPTVDLSGTQQSAPTSNYKVSLVRTETSADTASVTSLISEASGNYENITLTGSNGRTYTYVSDPADLTYSNFTIVDGEITFKSADKPKHPAEGVGYTFTYDAFSVEGTDTYSSANTTQEVSIAISDDAGNIGGNAVSYEQILSFASVSSTETDQDKIDSALGSFFSLTDNSGNSYVYGRDYRVKKGSSTDADTSKSSTAIEWISGGDTPANGDSFTLTFAGIETISTTLQRSATDAAFSPSVTLDDLDEGTVTITQGMKTFYEGVDFKLAKDSDGNAAIEWISDDYGGYEWFYPEAGTSYTVNFTDDDGNTTTYTGRKNSSDTINVAEELGMTTANGSISLQYGSGLSYRLDAPEYTDKDGNTFDGHAMIQSAYSVDVTKSDTGNGTEFNFRWLTPPLTSHSNLPSMNDEITVEYEYDANTFDLEDDSDGDLLYALGFVKSDKTTYDDYTAAKNAILDVDGEEVERDSNDIGEDYENELIKGVTLHLKGLGEVSLDISHDAEKAVTSIQSFVDNYNDLMSWMNTRMSEKEVDEDTKATIDSDDFRMRWGLLHGNSLLRNTKSQMRSLTSQNFTFSFTQRKSSEEIYGPMSFNGLKTTSTLRLRIGTKYVDVTIDPTDTLETIVNKINDDTKGGAMNDIYYDDNGEKLKTPLLKAYVENDKLVIQSSSNDEITMSGSAAMNALKMNYTYKGLYQIGIESTSDDYGKSGELVFDESEFMEALEDNPDEVQALMLKFVGNFDTWVKSMLNSSSSGETSGTLTREIENIQTQIDNINEYLENYQERLDRMEESLRTRYANTETQFSKLSQQANSIAAILNQLNGTASGGGYGQTSS